jgi:hypothetical protein
MGEGQEQPSAAGLQCPPAIPQAAGASPLDWRKFLEAWEKILQGWKIVTEALKQVHRAWKKIFQAWK